MATAEGLGLVATTNPSGGRSFGPAVVEAKADFTDHIQAGHGLEDLVEVQVAELRVWAAAEKVREQTTPGTSMPARLVWGHAILRRPT